VTRQYNKDASDQARLQFDAKAAPHKFLPNQLVLLDEHSFLGKNQKLAPKWTGPHKILSLKGDSNLEILLKHNNRKTVVHANRLKPCFVASIDLAVFPENLTPEDTPPPPKPVQQLPNDQNFPKPEDYSDTVRPFLPFYAEATSTQPSPEIKSQHCTHTLTSSSTLSDNFEPLSS
jgi:hypothetical protein